MCPIIHCNPRRRNRAGGDRVCNELAKSAPGRSRHGGIVTAVRTIITRTEKQMAFVQVEDLQAQSKSSVFRSSTKKRATNGDRQDPGYQWHGGLQRWHCANPADAVRDTIDKAMVILLRKSRITPRCR